jgi:hypothetical protein
VDSASGEISKTERIGEKQERYDKGGNKVENKVKQIKLIAAALLFALCIVTISSPALASIGEVMFTDVNGTPKRDWKVGDTLFITVIDPDENRDSDEVELIRGNVTGLPDLAVVELVDPNTGDRESSLAVGTQLVLQETGINTGEFRSAFGIPIVNANGPATPNNGILEVENNDTIYVIYHDPSDPTDVDADLGKIYDSVAQVTITDRAGNPIPLFNVGDDVFVTVVDEDENVSPISLETIEDVVLENPRTGDREILTLVETGPNTGVFRNVDGVTLQDLGGTTATSDHVLAVSDKDTIVAYYRAPGVVPVIPPPDTTRTDCITDGIEFCRTVPITVSPGESFTVTVTIRNLTGATLDLVAFSDDLPGGFTPDTETDFRTDLAADATATFTYQATAGPTPGTFQITGTARATGVTPLDLASPIEVVAGAGAAFLAPEVDVVEDGIRFTRDVPPTVAPGATFTVTVTITNLTGATLNLVAFSDDLPAGFAPNIYTNFEIDLPAGDTATFSYTAQASLVPGTYEIVGTARATGVTPLELASTIVVAEVPVGAGDPNDNDDFAIATAKIAETNPSTTMFTDEGGREKTEFRIGEDLFITVRDDDENLDSDMAETITVDVFNINGGREIGLRLEETGRNTGVFRNATGLEIVGVNTPQGQQDIAADVRGVIAVHNEDTVYVIYKDAMQHSLDPYDISLAAISITDTQVFTVAVNNISFVSDIGEPVDRYKKGQDAFVKVTDPDQNEDFDLVEQIEVRVFDRNTGDYEDVLLEETGPNTGVFMLTEGLPLELAPVEQNNGKLQVQDRDTIFAIYTDPNNPSDFSLARASVAPRPIIEPTPSRTMFTNAAGISVNTYVVGDNAYVTVEDPDENRLPGVPDELEGVVEVENLRTGRKITVDLTETGPDTGVFMSGPILLTELGGGGQIIVEPQDTLKATYTDPNDPEDVTSDEVMIEPVELIVDWGRSYNIPNPFEVTTTFKIAGVGILQMEVWVWDLTGRLVFYSGKVQGNTHVWDGTDLEGDLLANGVYLYRMKAYGRNGIEELMPDIKKLVILR